MVCENLRSFETAPETFRFWRVLGARMECDIGVTTGATNYAFELVHCRLIGNVPSQIIIIFTNSQSSHRLSKIIPPEHSRTGTQELQMEVSNLRGRCKLSLSLVRRKSWETSVSRVASSGVKQLVSTHQ